MKTETAGADQDTATARQTLPIQEFLSKAEIYASLITHFPTASQRSYHIRYGNCFHVLYFAVSLKKNLSCAIYLNGLTYSFILLN